MTTTARQIEIGEMDEHSRARSSEQCFRDTRLRREFESARLSWAKLIRRVYEVDRLLCPFCGAEMKILAVILDFATAKAIRKSLELPDLEPEPLAHAPPKTLELVAESAEPVPASASLGHVRLQTGSSG